MPTTRKTCSASLWAKWSSPAGNSSRTMRSMPRWMFDLLSTIRQCMHGLLIAIVIAIAPASAADLGKVLASAMAGTKTPALGMLVMRDGKIVQTGVRGVRRIDGHDPVRPDDVWLIGSDGKPMTATLIAKLADHDVLSWSTPLAKMLPGLAAKMRPEYRNVTLVQLLSHRSGLPDHYDDIAYFNSFFTDKRPAQQQRYDYIAH